MITEKDVEARAARMLEDAGFYVCAAEVNEGFKKPAVFISVYPSKISLDGADMELVEDTIEVKYIPAVETVAECADAAARLRSVFMHRTFDVCGRRLTAESAEFEVEEYILYAFFNLSYYQYIPAEDEVSETMEELMLGGI